MEEAPFGGTPGQWSNNLTLKALPKEGYRVIPGLAWWRIVHWGWRQYLAATGGGFHSYQAPLLANPSGTGLHLTDRESLRGLVSPENFAERLTLLGDAPKECEYYGCAVIQFNVPSDSLCRQGYTLGGAREWVVKNIRLNDQMQVTYIDVLRKASRHFSVTL